MLNGIKLDNNKVVIDLTTLHNTAVSEIIQELKTIIYNNNVDVFYVVSNRYENELHEFYFFKKFVEQIKGKFNIFLMLKTVCFNSTKFFDSIFALGVDALDLTIDATGTDSATIDYVTRLWPSGTIFTDIIGECSDSDIKETISQFTAKKVIPRIMKENACERTESSFCVRDFIIKSLKQNSVSLKWVMNFELCGIIQQKAGQKGRSKRKIAGRVAFELASLRRKLMVKEVQSSFDSASL